MSSREPDGADGAGAINGWELVGVPYTSMRQPGGIAGAIGSLRASGLAERLAELGVTDAGDLDLEEPCGERGPSGLLNERALRSRGPGLDALRAIDGGHLVRPNP